MAELDAAFFTSTVSPASEVEYILSTFKGIHERQTLFAGGASIAGRIVQKYAEMSSRRSPERQKKGRSHILGNMRLWARS